MVSREPEILMRLGHVRKRERLTLIEAGQQKRFAFFFIDNHLGLIIGECPLFRNTNLEWIMIVPGNLGIQQQKLRRPACVRFVHEFVSTAVGIVMQTHVVFPRLPGVSFSSRVPHMGKE